LFQVRRGPAPKRPLQRLISVSMEASSRLLGGTATERSGKHALHGKSQLLQLRNGALATATAPGALLRRGTRRRSWLAGTCSRLTCGPSTRRRATGKARGARQRARSARSWARPRRACCWSSSPPPRPRYCAWRWLGAAGGWRGLWRSCWRRRRAARGARQALGRGRGPAPPRPGPVGARLPKRRATRRLQPSRWTLRLVGCRGRRRHRAEWRGWQRVGQAWRAVLRRQAVMHPRRPRSPGLSGAGRHEPRAARRRRQGRVRWRLGTRGHSGATRLRPGSQDTTWGAAEPSDHLNPDGRSERASTRASCGAARRRGSSRVHGHRRGGAIRPGARRGGPAGSGPQRLLHAGRRLLCAAVPEGHARLERQPGASRCERAATGRV
jgi:hypothetical protein